MMSIILKSAVIQNVILLSCTKRLMLSIIMPSIIILSIIMLNIIMLSITMLSSFILLSFWGITFYPVLLFRMSIHSMCVFMLSFTERHRWLSLCRAVQCITVHLLVITSLNKLFLVMKTLFAFLQTMLP